MQKHIEVSLKASYRTLNELTPKTKRIWLVFHGYGMLTEFFIKKFEILNKEENFIIAPQGLSKFYLDGFDGRVGATWMTKEDRLTEIENQHRYVAAVLKKESIGYEHLDVILFGFSQGAATMCRFAVAEKIPFSKMVLWAGTIPHDMSAEDIGHWPKPLPLYGFVGTRDHFLPEERRLKVEQRIEEVTGTKLQMTIFEGKHEVIPELLLTI